MKSRAKNNLDLIKLLHKCGHKQQKDILKTTNREQILAICECVDNTLRGNVPLTSAQKKRLEKHKAVLRHLANTKVGWKSKQKTLTQKGKGIFSILLPAVIALLSSINSQ